MCMCISCNLCGIMYMLLQFKSTFCCLAVSFASYLATSLFSYIFFRKVSFTDPLSKLFPFKWKTYQEHDWVRFMFRKPILNFRFCNFFHFHSPPHLKFISRMQTFKFSIANAFHINFYFQEVPPTMCDVTNIARS